MNKDMSGNGDRPTVRLRMMTNMSSLGQARTGGDSSSHTV